MIFLNKTSPKGRKTAQRKDLKPTEFYAAAGPGGNR